MAAEAQTGTREERVPFRLIRRRTAEKMVESVSKIPHVSHFDEADVTDLEALRKEMKPEAEKKGIKLTSLAFIVKALTKTLEAYPNLNAVLDEEKQEIVHKKFYNVGIAVAAPQGLYVPVVKDAGEKDTWTVADEIVTLAGKVRDNKIQLPDIQGGTVTVTNIGPIGGTHATPIILHPQTSIWGVMKMVDKPVVKEGQIVIRKMMNIALSFDHRVLDGAEAAAAMTDLIKRLEDPKSLI